MKKHLNIRVSGKVQGVFYRQNTREQAQKNGICGWVKNQPDGTVYIEAEGEETALENFVAWCRRGPERARVTGVEVEEGTLNTYSSFEIKRD